MLKSEIHIAKAHGGCVDFLSTCNPSKHAASVICMGTKAAGSRSFNLASQGSFIEAEPPNPGGVWDSLFRAETEMGTNRDTMALGITCLIFQK